MYSVINLTIPRIVPTIKPKNTFLKEGAKLKEVDCLFSDLMKETFIVTRYSFKISSKSLTS